jgi:uncharacterized protein YacL
LETKKLKSWRGGVIMNFLAFIICFLLGCFICTKIEATGETKKMHPLMVFIIGLVVGLVAFFIVSVVFGH